MFLLGVYLQRYSIEKKLIQIVYYQISGMKKVFLIVSLALLSIQCSDKNHVIPPSAKIAGELSSMERKLVGKWSLDSIIMVSKNKKHQKSIFQSGEHTISFTSDKKVITNQDINILSFGDHIMLNGFLAFFLKLIYRWDIDGDTFRFYYGENNEKSEINAMLYGSSGDRLTFDINREFLGSFDNNKEDAYTKITFILKKR